MTALSLRTLAVGAALVGLGLAMKTTYPRAFVVPMTIGVVALFTALLLP
jgi:hypothetical protein